jgi:hypothetical protein
VKAAATRTTKAESCMLTRYMSIFGKCSKKSYDGDLSNEIEKRKSCSFRRGCCDEKRRGRRLLKVEVKTAHHSKFIHASCLPSSPDKQDIGPCHAPPASCPQGQLNSAHCGGQEDSKVRRPVYIFLVGAIWARGNAIKSIPSRGEILGQQARRI